MQIQGIVLLALIALNWILYHKVFLVFYFGGMRKSLTSEFIWCAIAACIELALIMAVGQWVLTAVFVIGGIILTIYVVHSIYKILRRLIKKVSATRTDAQSETDLNGNLENMADDKTVEPNMNPQEKCVAVHSQNETENSYENTVFCTICGNKIARSSKYCTFCGKENFYKERKDL